MFMKLRVILAVFLCKLVRFALRVLRRGGTALPGKIALAICPDLLRHLASGVECVAITGTNGKTTSARMLEQFFIDSGKGYISNKSGSNLMRGIVAEFALSATASGKPKHKHAIIECDEAASKKVFEYLDPAIVLVTNVFRDQLDRFGDVGVTLENIIVGVKNAPNATICLNADDSLVASIAEVIPNKVRFFGIDASLYEKEADNFSDAPNCLKCGGELIYAYRTYGHLGGYRCPSCGYDRNSPDIAVTALISHDADSQAALFRAYGEAFNLTVNLPGEYNLYNAAGAIAAAFEMGFTIDAAKDALLRFECGFGRMEKFELRGEPVRIILAKNTVGCNQVLNYLSGLTGDFLFIICLNDRIADGTDISWIEDVCFEKLLDISDRLRFVFVSVTRAADLAQRLKRSGFPDGFVRVFGDLGDMLDSALLEGLPVFIMPSYTAMLELRAIIRRRFGIKNFWE